MTEVFTPLNIDFDQQTIYNDLMSTNIFDKSFLATVIYTDGRSKYDKDGYFDDYTDVIHYDEDRNLVDGEYNTFVTYNFTHIPGIEETETQSFVETEKGRRPIWQVYDQPWQWKDDVPESLKAVVEELDLEYVSCVRLVGQTPPSKGIVHADASYKDNLRYFKKGGVAITLNVADGGGHLKYRVGEELFEVDESKHKVWHFDDSMPHCTSEITSPRIQIRVFGKRK
jgi:hypothetical protein